MWGAIYLAGNYAALGALALLAAYRGGSWGLISAELLLVGSYLLVTSVAQRSFMAYYASVAPLAAYMLLVAVHSFAGAANTAGPIATCIGTAFIIVHSHRMVGANRRMAASLDHARASAEASTVAKSAFVAMVSHELRTPISGMLAGAEELRRGARDAAVRNNAALVIQSAQMMRTLLNDLLDLSKIEAGRMGVENRSFDLRQTVLEVARFWRPELHRKGLRLRLRGAHALPAWVSGDPTRLKQILNNLFSNSVKFTERGGLVLALSVETDHGGPIRINLDVADTGPGMSEAQLSRLFSAYEQLGDGTAGVHGGTGLGLHISRELSRMMSGDLTVKSVVGEGSVFRLSVPFSLAEPSPLAQAAPEPEAPAQGRFLVVDDHEVNRRAFSLMLQPIADEVVCVEDGAQALAILGVEAFDVILMDLHLPGMDGLEVTRTLKSTSGPNRQTPVIALTGAASAQDMEASLAAGMIAHVSKPVDVRELFAAIELAFDGPAHDDLEDGRSAARVAAA
jgi:signal transduction histidine kinase/CheY-like chemotaxis protein